MTLSIHLTFKFMFDRFLRILAQSQLDKMKVCTLCINVGIISCCCDTFLLKCLVFNLNVMPFPLKLNSPCCWHLFLGVTGCRRLRTRRPPSIRCQRVGYRRARLHRGVRCKVQDFGHDNGLCDESWWRDRVFFRHLWYEQYSFSGYPGDKWKRIRGCYFHGRKFSIRRKCK